MLLKNILAVGVLAVGASAALIERSSDTGSTRPPEETVDPPTGPPPKPSTKPSPTGGAGEGGEDGDDGSRVVETGVAETEAPKPTNLNNGDDSTDDLEEEETGGGASPTVIIGGSVAAVSAAGAASALVFMKKKGITGSLLNAFSGNGTAGNMARENPLYNAATTEHSNPLYNPANAV